MNTTEKKNFFERLPYYFRLLFGVYIALAILCCFVFPAPDCCRGFIPLPCSNSVVILPALLLLACALLFTARGISTCSPRCLWFLPVWG